MTVEGGGAVGRGGHVRGRRDQQRVIAKSVPMSPDPERFNKSRSDRKQF